MSLPSLDLSLTAPVVLVAGVRAGSLATSVSVNVAGLAAHAGIRTLLVALDSPADAALDLGVVVSPDPAVVSVRPELDLVTFGARPPAPDLVARALRNAREQYDLVVIDGSATDARILALAVEIADHRLVPTRSDRAATAQVLRELDGRAAGVIGVVVAGVSARPRSHLVGARRALQAGLPAAVPVFAAALRAETGIAWWARDRGVLLHELVAEIDPDLLAAETVESVLRLGQDYRDVAAELCARIGVQGPV